MTISFGASDSLSELPVLISNCPSPLPLNIVSVRVSPQATTRSALPSLFRSDATMLPGLQDMEIGDPSAGRKIGVDEFCALQEKQKHSRIQNAMTSCLLIDFSRYIAFDHF